eukprot:gene17196-biopygen792
MPCLCERIDQIRDKVLILDRRFVISHPCGSEAFVLVGTGPLSVQVTKSEHSAKTPERQLGGGVGGSGTEMGSSENSSATCSSTCLERPGFDRSKEGMDRARHAMNRNLQAPAKTRSRAPAPRGAPGWPPPHAHAPAVRAAQPAAATPRRGTPHSYGEPRTRAPVPTQSGRQREALRCFCAYTFQSTAKPEASGFVLHFNTYREEGARGGGCGGAAAATREAGGSRTARQASGSSEEEGPGTFEVWAAPPGHCGRGIASASYHPTWCAGSGPAACCNAGSLLQRGEPVATRGACCNAGSLLQRGDPVATRGPCCNAGTLLQSGDPVATPGPCCNAGTDPVATRGPCCKAGTLLQPGDPVATRESYCKAGILLRSGDPVAKRGPCCKAGTLLQSGDPVAKRGPCCKAGILLQGCRKGRGGVSG